MPGKTSAGLLPIYVDAENVLRVFIGHMCGPFWAARNEGGDKAWVRPA